LENFQIIVLQGGCVPPKALSEGERAWFFGILVFQGERSREGSGDFLCFRKSTTVFVGIQPPVLKKWGNARWFFILTKAEVSYIFETNINFLRQTL
jgi:hypothetical protein